VLTGCTGSVAGNAAQHAPARGSITVINQNADAVRVFIGLGSTSYPLGRIEAFQQRTFQLPRAMGNSVVRLRIQPFGGRQSFTMEEMELDTDREVELWVANRLRASRIVMR
jgi:hypothetical protein